YSCWLYCIINCTTIDGTSISGCFIRSFFMLYVHRRNENNGQETTHGTSDVELASKTSEVGLARRSLPSRNDSSLRTRLRRTGWTSAGGFTFIEIIIAIAIVGLMAAVVGPGFIRFLGVGREKATLSTIQGIKTAII